MKKLDLLILFCISGLFSQVVLAKNHHSAHQTSLIHDRNPLVYEHSHIVTLGVDYLHGVQRLQYGYMFLNNLGVVVSATTLDNQDSLRTYLSTYKEKQEDVDQTAFLNGLGVRTTLGASYLTNLYLEALVEFGNLEQKLKGFSNRKLQVVRPAIAFGWQRFFVSGAYVGIRVEFDRLKKTSGDEAFVDPISQNLLYLELGYGL